MRLAILALAVLITASGCGTIAGFGPPPNYGHPEEDLLPHFLMVYGEPSDWFETTTALGRPMLSITWNCALDGHYHHAWFRLSEANDDLPFGGCWVVKSLSSGRGICN